MSTETDLTMLRNQLTSLDRQVKALLAGDNLGAELEYGQPSKVGARALFVGAIIPYYGAIGDIPDNWKECDGTNGTPDLRGRAVIGVDGSHVLGTAYGATQAGPLTHTGAGVSAHAGSAVADHASHTHEVQSNTDEAQSGAGATLVDTVISPSDGPNATLTHNVTQPSNHTVTQADSHAAFDIIPPSRALYWIMRIS